MSSLIFLDEVHSHLVNFLARERDELRGSFLILLNSYCSSTSPYLNTTWRHPSSFSRNQSRGKREYASEKSGWSDAARLCSQFAARRADRAFFFASVVAYHVRVPCQRPWTLMGLGNHGNHGTLRREDERGGERTTRMQRRVVAIGLAAWSLS